jgi:hypothetical protein
MLNNFSVQASVNEFYNAQRVYKEAASQALPQVNLGCRVAAGMRADKSLAGTL